MTEDNGGEGADAGANGWDGSITITNLVEEEEVQKSRPLPVLGGGRRTCLCFRAYGLVRIDQWMCLTSD